MVFAAAMICILSSLGLVFLQQGQCPAGVAYNRCSFGQDLRSFMSFALGSMVCCACTCPDDPVQRRQPLRMNDSSEVVGGSAANEDKRATQLHACLL